MPAVTPVTIPDDEPTVAIPGAVELHTPPGATLLSVVVAVGHTVGVPVIVPAFGIGFTVAVTTVRGVCAVFIVMFQL